MSTRLRFTANLGHLALFHLLSPEQRCRMYVYAYPHFPDFGASLHTLVKSEQ